MRLINPLIKELVRHYKEISILLKIKALLDWDLNVNLPPKAAEGRARQSSYITELIASLWLEPKFRATLDKATFLPGKISTEEKAILRNLNKAGKYYFRVPKEIVVEKEKVASVAFVAWKEAREKNDFSIFLPHLKELIRIDQIVAKHLKYDKNPYDALLDQFEPNLTAEKVSFAFEEIKSELVKLVRRTQKSSNYSSTPRFTERDLIYSRSEQELLLRSMMQRMGYDFDSGRIDVSPHPFTTTLDRFDVRITTMYQDNDFRPSYTSTMHEAGHALYEQGVNQDYSETPLEGGVSFGMHEALSRFWENMVGKSPSFIGFMYPLFQTFYPSQLKEATLSDLVKEINLVRPSCIRIEADEVTYTLHIILRFEIENALFNNDIKPDEVPEVWREKFHKYFGIEPKTDSEGVLQDVHWSYGAFGYFPAYALGNLYGAQLLNTVKKHLDFESELGKGNLLPIKGWLDQNIHRHGSLYYPDELMKKATGEKLNSKYFIQYLYDKYSKIYNFK